MKLFGQIVRTVVNMVTLPAAVATDAYRLAVDPCRIVDQKDSALADKLRQIKDEATDE